MKDWKSSAFGVIGLGRFGTALAISLAEAGKEVIVVDCNEDKVKGLRRYTEYAFVTDDLSKETLQEIGIQNCGTVIVCIGEKMDACILTTLNVVSLGVPHVIAKAISSDHGTVLEKIGAEVVYPERDMALRLGKRLVAGNNYLDFISLNNEVEIQQIPATNRIAGYTVEQLDVRRRYGLNIIAIESGGTTDIEISPQYKIQKEDILVVIGKTNNIAKFEKHISN